MVLPGESLNRVRILVAVALLSLSACDQPGLTILPAGTVADDDSSLESDAATTGNSAASTDTAGNSTTVNSNDITNNDSATSSATAGTVTSETSMPGQATAQTGSEAASPASDETVTESSLVNDIRAASITDVVLVTGQSNALGADTRYDPVLDTPHPRAFAFTETGWQVADLHQVWDLGWHPRNHPETDPSNNFGFHFARKVAERRPDRVVGFILVTAPGAGIGHWDYESDFYMEIRDRIFTAINELPGKSTIDGILWHQGETNWLETEYYKNKLDDLIRNFRGESWFGSNKPFICGETVEAPVNNILIALNNDGDPWTGCVASDGLTVILDDLHFSSEALRILGTRYATKYLQMTE